jgi:hypothetical protein
MRVLVADRTSGSRVGGFVTAARCVRGLGKYLKHHKVGIVGNRGHPPIEVDRRRQSRITSILGPAH